MKRCLNSIAANLLFTDMLQYWLVRKSRLALSSLGEGPPFFFLLLLLLILYRPVSMIIVNELKSMQIQSSVSVIIVNVKCQPRNDRHFNTYESGPRPPVCFDLGELCLELVVSTSRWVAHRVPCWLACGLLARECSPTSLHWTVTSHQQSNWQVYN